MTNAKEELIQYLVSLEAKIKCAKISYGQEWSDNQREFVLKLGASDREVESFFESLNFEYDDVFGVQNLFGTIWLEKDNTWLSRREYDGAEWWEYNECPEIPMEMF